MTYFVSSGRKILLSSVKFSCAKKNSNNQTDRDAALDMDVVLKHVLDGARNPQGKGQFRDFKRIWYVASAMRPFAVK